MKIVIATPLYPPDLAEPAPYVKELASRLSQAHQVSVVTYAHIPEKVPGVKILSTSKKRPLLIRIMLYTYMLLGASSDADVIYVQSGSSVGLPSSVVRVLTRTPLVVHVIEDEAWERAFEKKLTEKTLEQFEEKPEGSTKTKLIMWIQGFLWRRADKIVIAESLPQESIEKHYGVANSSFTSINEPLSRPEILPFSPAPSEQQTKYEESWLMHIATLEKTLNNVG